MTKKERKARKRAKEVNQHHVFPRSRCAELGITDRNADWNLVVVNARQHDLFHQLFGNKTPRETIDFLVRVFFNGMIDPPEGV